MKKRAKGPREGMKTSTTEKSAAHRHSSRRARWTQKEKNKKKKTNGKDTGMNKERDRPREGERVQREASGHRRRGT